MGKGQDALSPETAYLNSYTIASHIRFLADDLLEGRGPGTRGDKLTQLYLATQFQRMGLQAGAANDSWTQEVPLIGVTTQQPPHGNLLLI